MTFEQWLAAKGFDLNALTPTQEKAMRADYDAHLAKVTAPTSPILPTATLAPPGTQAVAVATSDSFSKKMDEIVRESQRKETIQAMTAKACQEHMGNTEKIRSLQELCNAACNDETVTAQAFELSLIRAGRFDGPLVYSTNKPEANEKILEAAVCQATGLKGIDKHFDANTLQQAHTLFRSRLTLKGLAMHAARVNANYRGMVTDDKALFQAAFYNPHHGQYIHSQYMAGSFSTIDVTGILSNTGNKFLTSGFLFTEQSWREWCKIRPVNDFKAITTYRMTGAAKFKKVPPGGELKHGTLGEASYTNQADVYGAMLGISYQDWKNDDLSAFTQAAFELARGAGTSLNEVIYTELLDDSAFFPTDGSLANYDAGATDSVLSLAGLENADAIFAAQTKEDGTPLGAVPAILFVPRGLRVTAETLMSAAGLVGQGQNAAPVPNSNPWAGKFRVSSSVYLSSSAISGSSATAWYLLADPMDIPVVEVVFVDGVDTPTIEYGEPNFNQLGVQMRAILNFGCNKQEYRGGVKLKGAA